MKLLERVLVAVDFGSSTDSLVASAGRVARVFGSELILMHVLPGSAWARAKDEERLLEMARQEAGNRLGRLRGRLAEGGVEVVDSIVAEGTAFDKITCLADQRDVNVIFASAKSEPGPGPRLGTTAERLCRKASKPVWLVDAREEAVPRTILCPVDFSTPSRRALGNAVHLARRFEARLVLLHVLRPPGYYASTFAEAPSLLDELRADADVRLQRLLEQFDLHGIDWSTETRRGDPRDEILESVQRHSIDLIVMGSVGDTGLARILLGSVATKVARELPCAVVMMKAEDAVRLKLDQGLADIEDHYSRGCELLENGFAREARAQFEHCVRSNEMFTPGWEALATALERLGEHGRAEQARRTGARVEEALAWRKIEAEIRSEHRFWKK
jgi:nucleotide-binding universal stress UspA family protein